MKTAVRTKDQNAKFHKLLTLRKLDKEDKAELVKQITDGRTTSSSKMTIDEMAKAIKLLEDEHDKSIKKMRSKIINIARDIFEIGQLETFDQKRFDALNKFLVNKFKEPLHKLDYKTLIKAVTAMEKWRESGIKKMLNELLNEL